MRALHVITDMQYGSCGKGLFAGYLARELKPDTVVTAWAPNAGHTFIDERGEKFVNIALPNAIVQQSVRAIMIGPGSVVNPAQMVMEIERYKPYLQGKEILIHPHAAIALERHREAEAAYGFRIGSTMKGVGEAVIEKMRRKPFDGREGPNIAAFALRDTALWPYVVESTDEWNDALDASECTLLEGAQGFSLSMNHGFYPYVTSRDCTTNQLLSDCGVPRDFGAVQVYGVARTFPIRVANRYAEDKRQIGWSGPCYGDQTELTWEQVGQPPELTTVTRLPRRVFTFSMKQMEEAVRMNGVHDIFLNFCNYIKDTDEEQADATLEVMIRDIEALTGARVRWTGWGPSINDIREL